ncbi:MAG: C39 family peptidase [Candidatus Daviesbacteria bacterium]|nr:MAG: C39 family peptidase [Candidatus Daviesbacteria bacterium]
MILDVPYYSQIKDTKNPDWQDKACGIVALKMVMDFYQPINLSIDDLYKKGLKINGYLEGVGWYHHSLALLAKNLGFKAITRSWNVNQEAQEKLQERGFDQADLEIMQQEQLAESLFTLKVELDKNHPIIISVPRRLKQGGSGHLVVLIGYDNQGFYVNDPDDKERLGQKIKINYSDFEKIWTCRAVFIYPKN